MRAGALRTRVTIQRPDTVADAVGQRIPTWVTVAERNGALTQVAGREAEDLSVRSITQWRLRLRYESAIADMTPAWRITTATQRFDIESVANQNMRNRELILTLVEVV